MKVCIECKKIEAVKAEKYCKKCRAVVLKHLDSDGYFTNPWERKPPSEQVGRHVRDLKALGGVCEMNNDGDDDE